MLAKEISWVLVVKLVLLTLIAVYIFGDPVDEELTPEHIAQDIYGTTLESSEENKALDYDDRSPRR